MAKKSDKALKDLAKEVKKLRKENEKLIKSLDKVRDDQADSHREILALLEERPAATDTGADEPEEYRGILDEDGTVGSDTTAAESADGDVPEASVAAQQDGQEQPEITDAARRRAEELGVDPTEVRGTGSGGRVLVKDVEAAAK